MEKTKAYQIAKEKMYDNDAFSKWLGIEIVELGEGHCVLKMKVRDEMTNGFKIAHGGITYSLADSALAFASNSHGKMAVSIETSISHVARLVAGDEIIATATEQSRTKKIAIYQVEVKKTDGTMAALFKGTVYCTSNDWL